MAEAVSDLVVKPYEGARKDGAKGAAKGAIPHAKPLPARAKPLLIPVTGP
jgi:hypothetical protein